MTMNSAQIYTNVGDHYGAAARTVDTNGTYAERVANAFGYSKDDLEGMPADANLGLSCGNPIALANLREGEVVVDLGSGAGFDVFQAARKVGQTGRAVGVDFNQDMLSRAESIKTKTNASNVEFISSPITSIPAFKDNAADVVISNCVINLVPHEEKNLVFKEMFRMLKSGGRVAVSDILAKGEMPDHVRNDMELYVGCIAGASQVGEYEAWLRDAGFQDVVIVDAKSDLNVYWQTEGGGGPCCGPTPAASACCGPASSAPAQEEKTSCCGPSSKPAKEEKASCCGPAKQEEKTNGPPVKKVQLDYNEFAGSYKIFAVKP